LRPKDLQVARKDGDSTYEDRKSARTKEIDALYKTVSQPARQGRRVQAKLRKWATMGGSRWQRWEKWWCV